MVRKMANSLFTSRVLTGGIVVFLVTVLFATHVDSSCLPMRHPQSPSITLKRRILANFVPGAANPYIKILFMSDQDVNVTWFRPAKKGNLPGADPPHMLQVAPWNKYFVSSLRSWNVRASTLNVNPDDYNNTEEVTYATHFEFEDAAISYRLYTVIPERIAFPEGRPIKEDLNGMEWVVRPNITITYEHGEPVNIGCTARKEVHVSQDNKGNDELILYNIDLPTDSTNYLGEMTENPFMVKVHLGDPTKRIDDQRVRYNANVNRCSSRDMEYTFNHTTYRGTAETQGLYVCRLRRDNGQRDMYASTTVRREKPDSTKPRVKLIPCEDLKVRPGQDLQMIPGSETCLRCQGYGDGISDVVLIKEGKEVQATSSILVRKHINVKQGGLRESVYTFLNPDKNLAGEYACVVRISGTMSNEAKFSFKIVVVIDKSSG